MNLLPTVGGVYCWYKKLEIRGGNSPYEQILAEMESIKFGEKSASLHPYYRVSLSCDASLPAQSQTELSENLKRPEILDELHKLLNVGILFQSPLYIGNARNLRRRIGQHLNRATPLADRLSEAGVVLERSLLLLAITDPRWSATYTAPDEETTEDGNEEEAPLEDELFFEEMLSRLFNPLFTLRYG